MIPKRFLLIFGTFLLSVLLYIDRACISAAKDDMTRDLGLSNEQWGWVLAAFTLGYAFFQTPAGILSDRFGPRVILTTVVTLWSLFTGLTGVVRHFATLFAVRFLFGAGEAGAFPGMVRAIYSWIPMKERGICQGINFSGSRLGGAFAMPLVAWMLDRYGWPETFLILMVVGFVWAIAWYFWFRNDPTEHTSISDQEKAMILDNRQQAKDGEAAKRSPLSMAQLVKSRNMWLAMAQYFCSNFTFFFCLTWLFPYLKDKYDLATMEAGFYTMAPLLGGAVGNVFSGWLMDRIYRGNRWKLSRQLPAMVGFALAAFGLVVSVFMESPGAAVLFLTVAIFGADMTLAPSWSFCIDIGRHNAGAVSGTMNMAGNIGSFVTALAFPYLLAWTESPTAFFFVGAGLNVLAILIWLLVKPSRPIEEY